MLRVYCRWDGRTKDTLGTIHALSPFPMFDHTSQYQIGERRKSNTRMNAPVCTTNGEVPDRYHRCFLLLAEASTIRRSWKVNGEVLQPRVFRANSFGGPIWASARFSSSTPCESIMDECCGGNGLLCTQCGRYIARAKTWPRCMSEIGMHVKKMWSVQVHLRMYTRWQQPRYLKEAFNAIWE